MCVQLRERSCKGIGSSARMKKGPDAVDKEVGQLLKRRRKTLSVSQQALAGRLGITFQQVQKYEKGANRVSAGRLRDMAIVLDVPVSYFFDGLVSASKQASGPLSELTEFVTTPDGRSLVGSFSRIGNAGIRRALISLVEKLADLEMVKESNRNATAQS